MRNRIWLLLCLCLLVPGLLACSDDDDPAEPLHGTWAVNAVGSYHTWEPDGTWYVATAPTGRDPYDFGTYTIDGSIVTFETAPDAPECPETAGSYEVTFIDADTISWELIEDDCRIRGVNIPRNPWERVDG